MFNDESFPPLPFSFLASIDTYIKQTQVISVSYKKKYWKVKKHILNLK